MGAYPMVYGVAQTMGGLSAQEYQRQVGQYQQSAMARLNDYAESMAPAVVCRYCGTTRRKVGNCPNCAGLEVKS